MNRNLKLVIAVVTAVVAVAAAVRYWKQIKTRAIALRNLFKGIDA